MTLDNELHRGIKAHTHTCRRTAGCRREIVSLGKSSSDQRAAAPEMSTRGHVIERGADWPGASHDVMVTRMPRQSLMRHTITIDAHSCLRTAAAALALAESTFTEGFQRFG